MIVSWSIFCNVHVIFEKPLIYVFSPSNVFFPYLLITARKIQVRVSLSSHDFSYRR